MHSIVDYFEKNFDLEAIKGLPITDKFRLIEYVKLVGKVNELYQKGGMTAVKNSECYDADQTFYLILSLLDAKVPEAILGDLVRFYVHNFEDSDIYMSVLVVLGSGALFIKNGVDTSSIMSYQISLLGEEFLKNNYTRIFGSRSELDFSEENKINIKYKDFDRTYRKLKYDLLALLNLRQEYGQKKLEELIYRVYGNKELQLYYSLLNVKNKSIADYLFEKHMAHSPKMDRFLLVACRSLIRNDEIIEMHYLLNSIIGKLTRFDKPYQEVIDEIKMRENEILALNK